MERPKSSIWKLLIIALMSCAVVYFCGCMNGGIRNANMYADEQVRESLRFSLLIQNSRTFEFNDGDLMDGSCSQGMSAARRSWRDFDWFWFN